MADPDPSTNPRYVALAKDCLAVAREALLVAGFLMLLLLPERFNGLLERAGFTKGVAPRLRVGEDAQGLDGPGQGRGRCDFPGRWSTEGFRHAARGAGQEDQRREREVGHRLDLP